MIHVTFTIVMKPVCYILTIPNKTLKFKGEQCKGEKLSKKRITILLCGNMVGDMKKHLVIGKSAGKSTIYLK